MVGAVPVSLGVLRIESVADMVANIWDVEGIEGCAQVYSSGNDSADNFQRARPNFAGLGVSKIWGSCWYQVVRSRSKVGSR